MMRFQGDNYTSKSLLDYSDFKNYFKMTEIDLGKLQALKADPKAMQQIDFIASLLQDRNATIFFVIEESKETILDFLQREYCEFIFTFT